jgi:hypothetical protein
MSLTNGIYPDITRTAYLYDRQQADPVDECEACGAEMFRGDHLYLWEGQRICGECLEEKINCMTIKEKADLIGAECIEAGE